MKNSAPLRSEDRPVVGRVSALGAGGICILHVAGTGAPRLIEPFFESPRGRKLADLSDGDIVYGLFKDDSGIIDEVLVVRRRADFWEINCHGGAAAVCTIEDRLASAGAAADRKTALHTGELAHMDPVRRAAYEEIIDAKTGRAVRMLSDQIDGALSRALNQIADDDNDAETEKKLDALLRTFPCGRALVLPRRVLIAGAPNVGKSTLLNRLLGYDRAITSPVPGTTVDRIGDLREIDGYPIEFTDGAGIDCGLSVGGADIPVCADEGRQECLPHRRTASRGLEKNSGSEADLVLFILDGSRELTEHEAVSARSFPGRLTVVNKCDLSCVCEWESVREAGDKPPVRISALTGEGVDNLLDAVRARLAPSHAPGPGSAVLFRKKWRDALLAATGNAEKIRAAAKKILEGKT